MSDAELIRAARARDADAYTELHRRHAGAARVAARGLCRNTRDADEVVSQAFAKALRAIHGGRGPDVAFRPYLLTLVRECFEATTRLRTEDPVDETERDETAVVAAFASLPERWQLALWHTDVEGRSVAEVAALLGMAPGNVTALIYRAREGLRQAFLHAHLGKSLAPDCRECAVSLAAYVRDRLPAHERRVVDEHLPGCDSCNALLIDVNSIDTTLRTVLVPAIVGVPAAPYSSGVNGRGPVARWDRLGRRQQAATAAAALAVGVLIAVVAAVVASAGGNRPTVAAPTTSAPRAVLTTALEATVTGTTPPTSGTRPLDTTSAVITVAPTTSPPIASAAPVATDTSVQGPAPTTAPPTASAPTTSAAPIVAVAPPTIAATTTTIAAVPQVSITSTQLGSAVLGGQARVQVSISATALPADQFRTTAAAGLVVSVPLPAGVSLLSADNPAWACTNLGSCTISSIAGDSSAAVLKLGIAATAATPIAFAPTITNPANAVVQATPIALVAAAVPGLMSQEFARGSVIAIGNTVMDCEGKSCADLDVDTDDATFNSSTADLSISGTVARAFLVWSGESANSRTPPDRDKVQFVTPDGGVLQLVADGVVSGYSSSAPDAYVAYMDVTGWMADPIGTFGVANIQTSDYGGWSLIVTTHDTAQPERSLMIALPLQYLTEGTSSRVIVPDASSPSTADAHVVVSAFEGDQKSSGDTVTLNGVDRTGGDAFGGRIVSAPRRPQLALNYEVDVLDVNATDVGAGNVTLEFATATDSLMIAAFGIALDLS